jgi:hypothetical protein
VNRLFFLFLNPIFAFKDSIYWVTFTLFLRKSGKKARTNLLGQKAGFPDGIFFTTFDSSYFILNAKAQEKTRRKHLIRPQFNKKILLLYD